MLRINSYRHTRVFRATNKPGIIATCFLLLVSVAQSSAQVLSKVQSNFAAYQGNNLQEKLYVHTNKTFYVTGEILWFKIYCFNGGTNKMLSLSKVAYVDILDDNHVAVLQAKIALKDGTGSGSLLIPVSLTNGNYQIRAYTSWMKNFGPDYFFERQLTIVNPLKTSSSKAETPQPAFDVQFFPEGGHLVNGLAGKVACKITGADGMGVAGAGAVVDQHNDTVARFKTLKFGIGSFQFKPSANNVYKAIIKIDDKVIKKELPVISRSGYVIHTTANNEGWDVTITHSDQTATSGIFLLVHNRHAVKIALGTNFANGLAHFSVSKSKLDDGLSYFTLFDEQQRPVCERLVFKRPAKKLIINAQAGAQIYGARKKVDLSIFTRDQDNKPLPANLSVSVFRTDSLQKEEARNIGSYLWLCSELKGYIESPDYYLDNNNTEADEALDNLMLSQGWTQFDWNNIIDRKASNFKFVPEYTGHIITGQVTGIVNHSPVSDIPAYLSVPGARMQLYTSKSDSTGRLLFNTHDFYGSSEIIVLTNTQIDSTYRIDITSPFSGQYSANIIPPLTLSANIEHTLAENSFDMQVQNIFKGSQIKQFYLPQADSTPFYGTPVKSYKLDDYTRFTTMEEVLREYVTSIVISKRQGKFNIRMFNGETPLNGQPAVLLDGTPVFDVDKIFALDPLKVKKLDVVSANYLYGPVIFNGIMSFTTYKGDMNGFEMDPRAVILDYEGLQLERKFYSPVYDSEKQLSSPLPDFRSVLYWNPEAGTNSAGKNNLIFYTSDKPGKYLVVVEGSSPNGEAGSRYFTFEVKR